MKYACLCGLVFTDGIKNSMGLLLYWANMFQNDRKKPFSLAYMGKKASTLNNQKTL